jgi:mono/diheme cytochrome c family protein
MKIDMKTILRARSFIMSILVSTISIAGAASLALALGSSAPGEVPPAASFAQQTAEGRSRFVQSCAHCHGEDAKGSGEDGDGPDLHALRLSDTRITTVIRGGIRGEMPAFAKKYSASDTATLVAYLRTLR